MKSHTNHEKYFHDSVMKTLERRDEFQIDISLLPKIFFVLNIASVDQKRALY